MLFRSFVPGKKLYDRVIWCLENRISNVRMIVTCLKDNKPEKIKFPEGVEIEKEFSPLTQSALWEDLFIPTLTTDSLNDNTILLEIQNWIGAIYAGASSFLNPNLDRSDLFVSSYFPSFDSENGIGSTFTWKGLLSTHFVMNQLTFAREKVNSGEWPWAAVSVWGFDDAPVSWKEFEHFFGMSGENDFLFLVLPNNDYVLYQIVNKEDEF